MNGRRFELRIAAILIASALVFVERSARADGTDTAMARSHYNAGEALFHLGRYREALEEFAAGYRLSNLPEFIIDIGQTYRKLDDLASARDVYSKYLAMTSPDAPYRDQVQKLLAEVDLQISQSPTKPRLAVETPTAILSPPPPAVVAGSTVGSTSAQIAVRPTTPSRSFIKRHWWIIPVATVAAAGIAVGIYFGVNATRFDCGSVSLGCVPLQPR